MTAALPDMWKISNVIPVHKAKESVNEKYRLISVLPVPSKILEKIVEMQAGKYLEANNIFFA